MLEKNCENCLLIMPRNGLLRCLVWGSEVWLLRGAYLVVLEMLGFWLWWLVFLVFGSGFVEVGHIIEASHVNLSRQASYEIHLYVVLATNLLSLLQKSLEILPPNESTTLTCARIFE